MATQLGTALKIGFSTYTYTGYIMESFDIETLSDGDEIHKDAAGATETVIIMDPATRIRFSALILDATGSLAPPATGATVTINAVAYRCEAATVKMVRGAARLDFQGVKEASMTYT